MAYLIFGICCLFAAVLFVYMYLAYDYDLILIVVFFLILGSLYISQFFIRCPECDSFTNDIVLRDDYCSECGYCYNPMTYCDCGASYSSKNIPRFCPDCGLVLDIEA